MKVIRRGVQLILMSLLGGVTQIGSASPLEGVCRTDAQTLANIRADVDQTLWNFMLSVCGENLATSVTPNATASTAAASSGVVTATAVSTASNRLSATVHQSPIAGDKAKSDAAPAAPETTFSGVELVDAASTGAEVAMPTKVTETDNATVSQRSVAGGNGNEVVVAPFKAERSIYELLATVSADQVDRVLPDPVDYKPSRFSKYRPDPYADWSASNQGSGYLKKPSVMESVPYGFYVGTSLRSNVPIDGRDHYDFPSLILGYSDERAIRDFNNYYGLGLRVEGMVERSSSKGDQTVGSRHNTYYLLGEVYQPLGRGFFVGLGARYRNVENLKVQVVGDEPLGEYDAQGYDIYFPVGFGFATPGGESGKLQFDLLISSRIKHKSSMLSAASFSDVTVKRGFGKGFAFEVNYSPYPKFEPFVRYEWYDKSDAYTYTVNGATISDREDISRSIEMGLRYYW